MVTFCYQKPYFPCKCDIKVYCTDKWYIVHISDDN